MLWIIPQVGQASGSVFCNCVSTVKHLTGYKLPRIGLAKNLIKDRVHISQMPAVGSILIQKSRNTGHVALIIELHDEGMMIQEGGWGSCRLNKRFINYNDPSILGYWR